LYSAYKFNRVTKRFRRQMNGISEIVCGSKGKYILLSRRCHCYPKTLASFKSRLILPFCPFWYRLTQVVLAKGPLNVCMCMCVCVLPWCSCSPFPGGTVGGGGKCRVVGLCVHGTAADERERCASVVPAEPSEVPRCRRVRPTSQLASQPAVVMASVMPSADS